MECFNDLLLKLREVHERELEGWQVKVQELSNKKGCDTKRMEELFNRNQQMKEQQRLLTENIKTLENRLRAGLCDRCTVTQEIAKKRQQDFEASHMQSLQHMSLLAGEMNNLKKENKRLRDEIKNLRAALSKRNNSDHFSNMSTTPEVKPNSSPDLSLPPVPVALIATATGRGSNQPSDESVAVKTETDKRSEDSEQQQQLKGVNRSHFEPYKHFSLSALTLPSRRPEPIVTRVAEKRVPSVEGLEQRPPILSHAVLFKNSSSSSGAEMNPSRHVLHAPVPCRPQPIKSSPVTLPWSLSESCDWVNAAAAGTMFQPSSKTNLAAFSNQMATSQHGSPRRNMSGSPWHKQSVSQSSPKEPTVVFRLKNLAEHVKSPTAPPEKKEIPPFKTERASAWLREANESPLDLSDRGKPKSSQTPQDDSPLTLQGGERIQQSPDKDVKTTPCPYVPVSSPSPVIACSSSSTSPAKQQEEELSRDHNHKIIKEQEQKEELNGKTSQNSDKKVPVLTISLRPVVVLETLNSALQKQESISNGKQLSPAVEPGSSSDEGESVSAQESSRRCKRKRSSVETEADIDSDTDNAQHERKIKIT